jgi:hypothetical protein
VFVARYAARQRAPKIFLLLLDEIFVTCTPASFLRVCFCFLICLFSSQQDSASILHSSTAVGNRLGGFFAWCLIPAPRCPAAKTVFILRGEAHPAQDLTSELAEWVCEFNRTLFCVGLGFGFTLCSCALLELLVLLAPICTSPLISIS